jgi:hypothetical protein
MENKLGNLRQNTLLELWHGDKINSWRIAHIKGGFSESGPLCERCNWKSAGSYPREKSKKWLKEYHRKMNK